MAALDHGELLLQRLALAVGDAERKHGLSAEQFPVSTYVGSSKNLQDLKAPRETPPMAEVAPPARRGLELPGLSLSHTHRPECVCVCEREREREVLAGVPVDVLHSHKVWCREHLRLLDVCFRDADPPWRQSLSQSPTDATRCWWHVYGS